MEWPHTSGIISKYPLKIRVHLRDSREFNGVSLI
jgi:hypothetical protein